jgi:GxxExxY protein
MLIPTNLTNDDTNLIYPKLSYEITGICFAVHNSFGRFLKEKRYCDLLEKKFVEAGFSYKREYSPTTKDDRVDFLIDDKIIIEVKAKKYILRSDYHQLQRYLQISHIKLGLIVNFRNRFLKPNRVVRIDTERRNLFV